jgi:hypothetical protein
MGFFQRTQHVGASKDKPPECRSRHPVSLPAQESGSARLLPDSGSAVLRSGPRSRSSKRLAVEICRVKDIHLIIENSEFIYFSTDTGTPGKTEETAFPLNRTQSSAQNEINLSPPSFLYDVNLPVVGVHDLW